MNYKLSKQDSRFSAVFLSPLERLDMNPVWGRAIAALAALYQYLRTDAFSGALLLVVFIGIVDYWLGVKAAKAKGLYDSAIAHSGAWGKVSGVVLLFLVRVLEGFVQAQGWATTRGAAATAIAISLFAVDLQSIAHHREEFGAQPIPLLGAFLDWLQRLLARVFSAPGGKP